MRKLFVITAVLLAVSLAASAQQFKVLVVIGDSYSEGEAAYVESLTSVESFTFAFDEVRVNPNPGNRGDPKAVNFGEEIQKGNINLSDYQIIWFTWNAPGHDGDYFMEGAEDAIREWVKNGGVLWMGAFDDNYRDQNGNQIGGWFPIDEHPVTVMNTGDSAVKITEDGEKSGLFSKPNKVDMDAITLDDNFAGVDNAFIVLAERQDNGEPAVFLLPYGKGFYVEVCYDTRDAGRLETAKPLLENGLYYCATLIKSAPVDPMGKLPATWGEIKAR